MKLLILLESVIKLRGENMSITFLMASWIHAVARRDATLYGGLADSPLIKVPSLARVFFENVITS